MNDRISGVYIYGGGPVRHYVFAGEQQRRRRTRIATLLLGAVFALLLVYCARIFYSEIAQPETATAEIVAVQQDVAAPASIDSDILQASQAV